jgi:hypothetical protein
MHRYEIGDITVTVLSDGFRVVPSDNYIANAGKDELIATLASAGGSPPTICGTLMRRSCWRHQASAC